MNIKEVNIQRHKLIFFILTTLFLANCSSTSHYSYYPKTSSVSDLSGNILGLPLVLDGIEPNSECLAETEKDIDEKLLNIWKTNYIPISEGKNEYKSLVDELTNHISSNSEKALNLNIKTILENNQDLCNSLIKASGSRYAIVPRAIKSDVISKRTLLSYWVIPLLPFTCIGGVAPIPWSSKKGELSAYTLTLIDLEKKVVVSEYVSASKGKFENDCVDFPKVRAKDMMGNKNK